MFMLHHCTQDWLGLAKLDTAGRLKFLEVDGDHLRFSAQWFLDNIVQPYLADTTALQSN